MEFINTSDLDININSTNTHHNRKTGDLHSRRARRNNDTNRDDDNSSQEKETTLPLLIYRFKFSEDFTDELFNFSKIHQYDDRKDFKDAWNDWIEENSDIIEEETERLTSLGYEGDILDKMFKSARYYFRKKSSEKKTPNQRRPYISVNKSLLDAMDVHIETHIYDEGYQPKTGFVEFCLANDELLKETIKKIVENGVNDSKLIQSKIKKTYKNRYFILANKSKSDI